MADDLRKLIRSIGDTTERPPPCDGDDERPSQVTVVLQHPPAAPRSTPPRNALEFARSPRHMAALVAALGALAAAVSQVLSACGVGR